MDAKMLAHTHTVAAAAAIDHQDLCALKGSQDTNYAITSDDFRGDWRRKERKYIAQRAYYYYLDVSL